MTRASILIALMASCTACAPLVFNDKGFDQPCRSVSQESPEVQAATLSTDYLTAGFSMRRERGTDVCSFNSVGEGRCFVRSPGVVHVKTADADRYFVVQDRDARLTVSAGAVSCHYRP